MKRFITILVFASLTFLVNAQHRIQPAFDITQETYDEAIGLIDFMEQASHIEKIENIDLHAKSLSTSGYEIILKKDGNSINIMNGEFTKMLNDYCRWYDIDTIRTELIIQTTKMFEYMSERLSENRRIKNMYIKIDKRTGGAYICITYYEL